MLKSTISDAIRNHGALMATCAANGTTWGIFQSRYTLNASILISTNGGQTWDVGEEIALNDETRWGFDAADWFPASQGECLRILQCWVDDTVAGQLIA